jgi:serine/threonine protein phosphatase PrpC
VGICSSAGLRSENQDYAASTKSGDGDHGQVAAVADGVSSVKGARIAAQVTVGSFLEGYFGLPPAMSVEFAVRRAVNSVNSWMHEQRKHDESLKGMACTLSAIILRRDRAHVVHVGDSRIYRLRNSMIHCLTVDHVHHDPEQKNIVLQAIGIHQDIHILYDNLELRNHDRYLLCTDGVHGVLSDKVIGRILKNFNNVDEAANNLVELAKEAGSRDNLTALVVDVVSMGLADRTGFQSLVSDLPIRPLPNAGQTIDDYLLKEIVSEGRYARIFKAEDLLNDRTVALKFPSAESRDSVYRSAFIRELWVGTRIENPWVVKVIAPDPGRQTMLYSVMPFYEGESLENRTGQADLSSLPEILRIGISLANGVAALNRNQVIHRDIKPANVMLLPDGDIKLLDLGVVRAPGLEPLLDQRVPGTPNYMAPEMYHGAAGDEKTDVYALGVTLYRLLTGGYFPYGEVGRTGPPHRRNWTSARSHRKDLPAWLEAVLEKAVALNPKDRYMDAAELADELEAGLSNGRLALRLGVNWYHRHALLFWQLVSGLLLIGLTFSLLAQSAGEIAR